MTAGTNHADTPIGEALHGCAAGAVPLRRSATIRASSVSRPTCSARMTNAVVPLSVPPMTASPGALPTGSDSPVTIDSSTLPRPSSTTPSTGIFSPGRTRSRSPPEPARAARSARCRPRRVAAPSSREVEQRPKCCTSAMPRAQVRAPGRAAPASRSSPPIRNTAPDAHRGGRRPAPAPAPASPAH